MQSMFIYVFESKHLTIIEYTEANIMFLSVTDRNIN